MSSLAYFILFAQACLILNASGALGGVIAPFGYEAGLGGCGGCGLATGIAGPCGLNAFTGPYGVNAPFAGAYGCGAGLAGYGLGAGFGPYAGFGAFGAPLIV